MDCTTVSFQNVSERIALGYTAHIFYEKKNTERHRGIDQVGTV